MRAIEPEGAGADAAAALLAEYQPATRQWVLPKTGEFWDAVAMAHSLNRLGQGRSVSVIDIGFDLSIPALAECTLDESVTNVPSPHGSAVALLIREVAPMSEIVLYPASVGDVLSVPTVRTAIGSASAAKSDVINLSLTVASALGQVNKSNVALGTAPRWDNMTDEDFPYWVAEQLGETGWRTWLDVPTDELAKAAEAASGAGATVIAAAGNNDKYAYSPAASPSVCSVAFLRSIRTQLETNTEIARAGRPSYNQTNYVDFAIVQPENVVGTSFAAPLMSGLAALMEPGTQLAEYRDTVWASGVASELMSRLIPIETAAWNPRRQGVVEQLFQRAITDLPHSHDKHSSPCPECSFLAAETYINFGLFKLRLHQLNGADELLSTARAVAPTNPFAAANLAMLYATRAGDTIGQVNTEVTMRLLTSAIDHMTSAVSLLETAGSQSAGLAAYRNRIEEWTKAVHKPSNWTFVSYPQISPRHKNQGGGITND